MRAGSGRRLVGLWLALVVLATSLSYGVVAASEEELPPPGESGELPPEVDPVYEEHVVPWEESPAALELENSAQVAPNDGPSLNDAPQFDAEIGPSVEYERSESVVQLAADGQFVEAPVPGLPIVVGPIAEDSRTAGAIESDHTPSSVLVTMPGTELVEAAGLSVLGVQLVDASANQSPDAVAGVRMTIDYNEFRYRHGGDWAARLQIVKVPACALTTPLVEECQAVETVTGGNDPTSGVMWADVVVDSTVEGEPGDGGLESLAGFEYQTEEIDAGTGAVRSRTMSKLSATLTGSYGGKVSWRTDLTESYSQQWVGTGSAATSSLVTTYDAYGMPTLVHDKGDISDPNDDICTYRSYARNATAVNNWRINLVAIEVKASGGPTHAGGYAGNCIETNELGYHETYYDGQFSGSSLTTGFVTKTRTRESDSATMQATLYTANANNQVQMVDGPLTTGTPDETDYTYNTWGFQERVTDALGHNVTTSIDPGRGVPTRITDDNNVQLPIPFDDAQDRVTTMRYDPLGRLLEVELPGDATGDETIQFEYSVSKVWPDWTKKRVLQSAGVWVEEIAYHDSWGRLRESHRRSPVGSGRIINGTQYDGRGMPVKEFSNHYDSNWLGSGMITISSWPSASFLSETRTTYDNPGRVTKTALWSANAAVNKAGSPVQTTWTFSGRWTNTNPSGGTTSAVAANVRGQTVISQEYNTTWAGAMNTTYVYDGNGNMVKKTDPKTNDYWYTYDNFGRITRVHDPDSYVTLTTYNADSTIHEVTTAAGKGVGEEVIREYTWDVLGRPLEVKVGATVLERTVWDKRVDATHGESGLVDYVSSFNGGQEIKIDTLGYDDRSRPTGYTYTIPSITGINAGVSATIGTFTFDNFVYDRADHLKYFDQPLMGTLPAERVTTTYNNYGYPITLTSPAETYVSATAYGQRGPIGKREFSVTGTNDEIELWPHYDPATQLSIGMDTHRNGLVTNEVVTHDALGNPISVQHDRAGTASDHLECFDYDGRSNLRTAYSDTATPFSCTSPTTTGTMGYLRTYTIDEIGNFATPGGGGPDWGPDGTYNYPNANGGIRPHAPTTTSNYTFDYFWNGNMKSRTTSGVTTNYTWDPFNRLNTAVRAGVTLANNAYYPGGERALLKDPDGTHLYLGDLVEVHVATGGVVTYKRNYKIGGQPVAVRTTTASTNVLDYLVTDIRGSSTTSIRKNGAVATTTTMQWYTPWGDLRASGTLGTITTRQYIGQHRDTHTGLNYLNNRYYLANVGIFASVDPLTMRTGEPYLYASGNPTGLADASGLCTSEACRDGSGKAATKPFAGNRCGLGGRCQRWGTHQPATSSYAFTPSPGYGTIYFMLFISDDRAGVPAAEFLQSEGNDRTFSAGAGPEQSKAWGVVDFENGLATIGVSPSCGTGGAPGDCHAALPLSSDASLASSFFEFLPFVSDSNKVTFSERNGTIRVGLHVKNSDKKTFAPRIDVNLSFHPLKNSDFAVNNALINMTWDRDPFPSFEVYRIGVDGGISTVLQDPSGGVAALSLTPAAPNHNGETISFG